MHILILYDSQYGNTELLAETMADACSSSNVQTLRVDQAKAADIRSAACLIVGTPTQGGRPTKPLQQLLSDLPDDALRNMRVAAFDTRMSPEGRGFFLRTLLKVVGYAAPRTAAILQSKGGRLVSAEGFIVDGREGPLRPGEKERAIAWMQQLLAAMAL